LEEAVQLFYGLKSNHGLLGAKRDPAGLFRSVKDNGNVQFYYSKDIPDEIGFSIYN